MARNQTVSYLRQRFAEVGIQPDSRHGQNFLIDMNLLRVLVDAAELGPSDVVLEVGTGTGGLTEIMAERAGAVVTVEIDQHLYQMAGEVLIDRENVTMLHQDALKNKNRFHPNVIAAVQEALVAEPGRQFKLAANLPYSVATPILTNLLSCEVLPVTMTATIQKELADRIAAPPSTSDYSSLSIWIQSQCDVEVVRILPPQVFWPAPKVYSAILHLTVNLEKRARIPELTYFHQFVRMMFIHRRKFLRSNLLGAMKNRLTKPEVDEVMRELEFAPNTRAEELDVETMIRLCEAVRRRAPDWKL